VNLSTLDLILLGVLLLSALVGVWRGLTFEVLSLAGWVAAYIAAQVLNPWVAAQLPVGAPGSAINHGAAFALTFIAVLIVWALLARLVRALVHATPLSGLDRLFGAAFGVLRGLVLLLAVATLVLLTPAKTSPTWQQSQIAQALGMALRHLKPLLPDDLAQHLPA
jgi:membrane protein required for colicin V production